nr:hypothetical protein [Tanacetum cinerariifolium]
TPAFIDLVSCDGLGGYDWGDQAEEGPKYTLMAYTSSTFDSKVLKVEIQMKEIAITELRRKLEVAHQEKDGIKLTVEKVENASKSLNKLIGNFMPPKPDLSYTALDEFVVKLVVENKSSEEETKAV